MKILSGMSQSPRGDKLIKIVQYCTISIYLVWPCDHDMFDGFGVSVSTFKHCDRGKKFSRSGKNWG